MYPSRSSPPVSVVMPVRNGMPFLDSAIVSILEQDMADFEFVILDDASRDGTYRRLQYWSERDGRIRILRRDQPLGLVGSSQLVTSEARAPLIARMDADDVSRSDRLRLQRLALEGNPGAALTASLVRGIDAAGRIVRPIDLRRLKPGGSTLPAPHSTWMVRSAAFDDVGGYEAGTDGWEDTSLFHRLADRGEVLILPDALTDFRYHAVGSTVMHSQEERERALVDQRNVLGDASPVVASDAYRLRAAMRVWSGYRPDISARFPRFGGPGWLPRFAAALLYATWGRMGPRSLRVTMAWMITARNWMYRADYPSGRLVVWRRESS